MKHPTNRQDDPKFVTATVLLGTLGVLSFIVQPALVQAFVEELNLGEAAAVDLTGIEMLGVAGSTVALAILGSRTRLRLAVVLGTLLAIAGNAWSAIEPDTSRLAAARLLAGVGHGALISLSFTLVGMTASVRRNLALYLVALLTYGAVGLWALPRLVPITGLAPVFAFFAVAAATGLAASLAVPKGAALRTEPDPRARQLPAALVGAALAGVLSYNVAQGIAWAILFLVGLDAGLAPNAVGDVLLASQVAAIAGALASVALAERTSPRLPIVAGILLGAGCIALLMGNASAITYVVAVCGFNLLWNLVLPFILAQVGEFDERGRLMAPAIAMQMVGLAAGPLIAARLIGGGYFAAEAVCVGFFLASLLLLAPAMRRHGALLTDSGRPGFGLHEKGGAA